MQTLENFAHKLSPDKTERKIHPAMAQSEVAFQLRAPAQLEESLAWTFRGEWVEQGTDSKTLESSKDAERIGRMEHDRWSVQRVEALRIEVLKSYSMKLDTQRWYQRIRHLAYEAVQGATLTRPDYVSEKVTASLLESGILDAPLNRLTKLKPSEPQLLLSAFTGQPAISQTNSKALNLTSEMAGLLESAQAPPPTAAYWTQMLWKDLIQPYVDGGSISQVSAGIVDESDHFVVQGASFKKDGSLSEVAWLKYQTSIDDFSKPSEQAIDQSLEILRNNGLLNDFKCTRELMSWIRAFRGNELDLNVNTAEEVMLGLAPKSVLDSVLDSMSKSNPGPGRMLLAHFPDRVLSSAARAEQNGRVSAVAFWKNLLRFCEVREPEPGLCLLRPIDAVADGRSRVVQKALRRFRGHLASGMSGLTMKNLGEAMLTMQAASFASEETRAIRNIYVAAKSAMFAEEVESAPILYSLSKTGVETGRVGPEISLFVSRLINRIPFLSDRKGNAMTSLSGLSEPKGAPASILSAEILVSSQDFAVMKLDIAKPHSGAAERLPKVMSKAQFATIKKGIETQGEAVTGSYFEGSMRNYKLRITWPDGLNMEIELSDPPVWPSKSTLEVKGSSRDQAIRSVP